MTTVPNLLDMLALLSIPVASTNSFPVTDYSWLIICLLIGAYFAPALVAFLRRQHNRWLILTLNILFGWTVVGWMICLAWAARAPSGQPIVVVSTAPTSVFPSPASGIFATRRSLDSDLLPFQTDGPPLPPDRPPHSTKLFLFRLVMAAIALAVVVAVTASQRKPSSRSKARVHRVPPIRNIDPYRPSPPSVTPRRHYPSPELRSHQGYY
jgi:Superinfection immunity protein